VTAYAGITSVARPGFRPLRLDLHRPDAGAVATVLYLHGGGWRVGSREVGPGHMTEWSPTFFERLTARGVAVVAADYRLSGEARYPAQLDDAVAAVRWVAEHGSSYDVPTERIGLWGASAGGHLAALLALGAGGPLPVEIDVACLWFPVVDLLGLPDDVDAVGGAGDRGADSREGSLLGGPPAELADAARQASPLHHAELLTEPPATRFAIFHGTADHAVPLAQSERFVAALEAAGADVSLERVDGVDHIFTGLPDEELAAVTERSIDALLG
jgi:acetyl esterase/lipase